MDDYLIALHPQYGRFTKLGSLGNLAKRRLWPILKDSKPHDKHSVHRDKSRIIMWDHGIVWITLCVSHTKINDFISLKMCICVQILLRNRLSLKPMCSITPFIIGQDVGYPKSWEYRISLSLPLGWYQQNNHVCKISIRMIYPQG